MNILQFPNRSILRNCLVILAALLSSVFLAPIAVFAAQPALTCPNGTTIFDWDTPANTWAAGSLNNSYAVTNLGTINYAITTTGGTWVTDAAYGGTAPFRQNVDTYGMVPVQYTLQMWMDFLTNAQTATTVITLPTAVPGLQFSIFDVDFSAGNFTDKVTVTGSFNGSPVTANLATHNTTPSYTITGNVAVGNAVSTATQMNGRVWVTFSAPVDKVTVVYGNETTAPANPTRQAIDLHDITFCNPQANLNVTKISSVISDGVSTTNPKAISGATIQYCITVSNPGSATATAVTTTDILPANVTFVPGSMRSGATCGTAATVEDDDNSGADETDPFGMAISGTTVTGTAASLGPAVTFAMTLLTTIN